MSIIKRYKSDGTWEYVSVDGSNADTLDGKHASDFYTKEQIDDMEFITINDIDTICGSSITVATLSKGMF